jgi:hypothetical protein
MILALFNFNPLFQKAIIPSPTPTPAPTQIPISVTLSPATQNVDVILLYHPLYLNLTITGNPAYPCKITLNGGNYPNSLTPKTTIDASGVHGPIYSNATSKTFFVSPNTEDSTTVFYFVSVVDSIGNTFTSNQVQVTWSHYPK